MLKKGDKNNPANHRGITLISSFAKLFTVIINERLKKWTVEYDVISHAQFGFKSNIGMVDAIFLLYNFIQKQLKQKKMYCCFIDLKPCFDSVYRNGLWVKLLKTGVDGNLFNVIRSIYNEVKLCVRHFNTLSDLFNCEVGLLQRKILSPSLFFFLFCYRY